MDIVRMKDVPKKPLVSPLFTSPDVTDQALFADGKELAYRWRTTPLWQRVEGMKEPTAQNPRAAPRGSHGVNREANDAHHLPPHPAPVNDPTLAPRGLDQSEVEAAVVAAEGDPQAAWNRILAAYLDGDISLGRAAQLLGVDRFELTARLGRLELPLHLGSATPAEARQELARLDA